MLHIHLLKVKGFFMPTLATLLKEEISKIVRKEVQDQVRELNKTVREQRGAIARLEKQVGPAKAKTAAKPAAAKPAAKASKAPAGDKGDKRKQPLLLPFVWTDKRIFSLIRR